jgi:hypothetical protein
MKKLKMLFGAALALALAFAPVVSVYAESENTPPQVGGSYGGLHPNLDFYGVKPCRITNSTTAVLCKSGEGFLDAVCASGGVSPQYSLALDSGIAGSRSVTNSDSLVLTPMVFSVPDTAVLVAGAQCWTAKMDAGGPVKFVNGLLGVQSGATNGTTILYWHYSSGLNP